MMLKQLLLGRAMIVDCHLPHRARVPHTARAQLAAWLHRRREASRLAHDGRNQQS